MDFLFVILRLLIGSDCFPTERLEPVMVRADGRSSSARTLPGEYLQSRFRMSWPNLRHVRDDPFVDASPVGDVWTLPPQCWAFPSKDTALLARRNPRS